MNVLFIDRAAFVPYEEQTPTAAAAGIGGAEASLAHVAVALAETHAVTVVQGRRTEPAGSGGVAWTPLRASTQPVRRADAIVVQRRISDVVWARLLNRRARIVVWYHDWYFAPEADASSRDLLVWRLKAAGRAVVHRLFRASAVVVSDAHRENLGRCLRSGLPGLGSRIAVDVVANPVVVGAAGAGAAVDADRMIFFSAAWKGLSQVLERFAEVRAEFPEMTLQVATPGYGVGDEVDVRAGVVALGNLSHGEVLERVRDSLCVFYPANAVPETFGLVFAEAHAVGTPVIAHDFGAASELLTPEELVDATDIRQVVDRVRAWRSGGRPVVTADPRFALSQVVARWDHVLAK